jgi:hypothetical protein
VAGDALRDPFIERNSLPREVTGTVPDLTRGLTVWLDQAVVIVTLARRLLGMAIAGLIGLGSVVLGIVVLLTLGQCNPVKAPHGRAGRSTVTSIPRCAGNLCCTRKV